MLALVLCSRRFHALIYSHVIDQHLLWEDGSFIRVPGPISADGEVKENKKRLIEDPRLSRRKICWGSRLIKSPITVKAHDVRLPLDGEDMKRIGKSPVFRQ